jgi:hypothetical protein
MPRLYGSPPTPDWFGALDELAAGQLRLKLRTGGEDADAFPAPHELAGCIDAALDREMPFKCTAGLHRAVRHRENDTGFEHHGFLNVLVATRAALDGVDASTTSRVLAETDPGPLTRPSNPRACRPRAAGSAPSARAACRSPRRPHRPRPPGERVTTPRGWRAPPARCTTSTTCPTACSRTGDEPARVGARIGDQVVDLAPVAAGGAARDRPRLRGPVAEPTARPGSSGVVLGATVADRRADRRDTSAAWWSRIWSRSMRSPR